MLTIRQFFDTLFIEGDYIQLRGIKAPHSALSPDPTSDFDFAVSFSESIIGKRHVYFGVNPRNEQGDITAVRWIWADLDGDKHKSIKRLKNFILSPTLIVDTGGGYHAYWKLRTEQPPTEELKNKIRDFQVFMEADPLPDFERLFRVPNTKNIKYNPPKTCRVVLYKPEFVWDFETIAATRSLSSWWHGVVKSGSIETWGDRSRRDWAFWLKSLRLGFTDLDIRVIFEKNPNGIGSKVFERGIDYLDLTSDAAHEAVGNATDVENFDTKIEEQDGYYSILVGSGKNEHLKKITNWLYLPEAVLREGLDYYWSGKIQTLDGVFDDVVIPIRAFDTKLRLLQNLSSPDWEFMGTDADAVQLRNYIRTVTPGMPEKKVVRALGRHGDLWLTKNEVYNPKGESFAFIPRQSSYDLMALDYTPNDDPTAIKRVLELLFKNKNSNGLNRPEVMYPLMGWFCATPYKPVIHNKTRQFPLLNLFGTTGSGKTSLVASISHMFGYKHTQFLSVRQSVFVRLHAFASTNAIPVILDEYRPSETLKDNNDKLHEMLIGTYNGMLHGRGNMNQTITAYPLSAPIVILGEEPLEVPALKHRMIQITLHRDDVLPSSLYFDDFRDFERIVIDSGFSYAYVQWCMHNDFNWDKASNFADKILSRTDNVPDRIKHNILVACGGILSLKKFAELHDVFIKEPSPSDFMESVKNVYNIATGKVVIMADEFVYDLIHGIVIGDYEKVPVRLTNGILWVGLKPSYDVWVVTRRHRNLGAIEYRSLRVQLAEIHAQGGYIIEPHKYTSIHNKTIMAFGINVELAAEELETPKDIKLDSVTVRTW